MKSHIERILERVKQAHKLTTDTELAELLGVSQGALSNWKSRASGNIDLIFSKCESFNLNWLYRGTGPMIIQDNIVEEPHATYRASKVQQGNQNDGMTQFVNFLQRLIEQRDGEINKKDEMLLAKEQEIGRLKQECKMLRDQFPM